MKIFIIFLMMSPMVYGIDSYRYSSSDKVNSYDLFFKDSNSGALLSENPIGRVDANVDLGIGTDCGKLDLKKQLDVSALKMMTENYFDQVTSAGVASMPLFFLCRIDKALCETIKTLRLNASLSSLFSINHCKAIDKFTSSKMKEYFKERNECTNKQLTSNGGDWDAAIRFCRAKTGQTSWTGRPKSEGRLLQDSSEWLGINKDDAKEVLTFLKPMVGELIINKDKEKTDFGDKIITPSEIYHASISKSSKLICVEVSKLNGDNQFDRVAMKLNYGPYLTYRMVNDLRSIPISERKSLCNGFVASVEKAKFENKLQRAKEFLLKAMQNPNLGSYAAKKLKEKMNILNELTQSFRVHYKNIPNIHAMYSRISVTAATHRRDSISKNRIVNQDDSLLLDCFNDVECEGI